MSIVSLVSGGIDSTLIAVMLNEERVEQYPLFINYGQLAYRKEWEACQNNFRNYNLPEPQKMDVEGFGKLIESGITNRVLNIVDDAFLPNRNLLFITLASAYAFQLGANTLAIGFLDERFHIFPDQTKEFIFEAELAIEKSLGKKINVVAPLMKFTKSAVLALAAQKGITNTYSCHKGDDEACGVCISCLEILNSKKED
jgi:7-cyano-7-deazaguanine synthase